MKLKNNSSDGRRHILESCFWVVLYPKIILTKEDLYFGNAIGLIAFPNVPDLIFLLIIIIYASVKQSYISYLLLILHLLVSFTIIINESTKFIYSLKECIKCHFNCNVYVCWYACWGCWGYSCDYCCLKKITHWNNDSCCHCCLKKINHKIPQTIAIEYNALKMELKYNINVPSKYHKKWYWNSDFEFMICCPCAFAQCCCCITG